jgi:glycosyltransferase involved in cell wall biosynthesis
MPPSIEEYIGRAPSGERFTGGRAVSQLKTPGSAGLVTVITVCFNSAQTIDRTIDSVAAQTWPAIQYIVIDGGSKDGTLERLKARSDAIDLWISEPDSGISDAFNKGIALAAGEYVALLNSDDWLEPEHLERALRGLAHPTIDFVYGDLMFHPPDGQEPYLVTGEQQYARRLAHTMPDLNHPSVVCRRTLYERHGLYDTRLRVAMDYEWFLRGYRRGARGTYVPQLTTHMSMEGVSHRHFRRGLMEVRDVSVEYGYPYFRARLRFLVRVGRPGIRRTLERWMPRSVYLWLRRRVNPHYRSFGTDSV